MSIPKRIRKEISPSTKTSPAKASFQKIEKHRKAASVRYLICLSLKYNKKQHNFHVYTLYILLVYQ